MVESGLGRDYDGTLGSIVELIAERMLAGESFSDEQLRSEFPQVANELSELLPTIELMHRWGLPSRTETFEQSDIDSVSKETEYVEERPETLGDFRIVRELGRGGMGIVYEAEQLSLKRSVALKVLPLAALFDATRLERFRVEARAAAVLKHPNIISVHAIGCERGVHFFAMDLVRGRSLAEVIAAVHAHESDESNAVGRASSCAPRDPATRTHSIQALSTDFSVNRSAFYKAVARLGAQASEAVHFAHQGGVIHRDLKPSNFLVDSEGNLHIGDFGLALLGAAEDAELTLTGDVVGTLRYMSPEQLAAASFVDPRTDVYSMGATLYELLVGRPAITGNSKTELLRNIVEFVPPDVRKYDPQVPGDLATIVATCLAKSPEDRYESAEALADDLRRFQQMRPILARKSPLWKNTWRWARRNRRLATAASVALSALLAIAIGSPIAAWKLNAALLSERAAAAELAAQNYDMHIRNAAHSIDEGHYNHAALMLDSCPAEYRDFEWAHLRQAVTRDDARTITRCNVAVRRVALGPKGTLIAFADWYGNVEVFDRRTKISKAKFRLNAEGQAIPFALEFSADGSLLFVGGERWAVLFDVESGQVLKRWNTARSISAAAFSNNGGKLALGYMAGVKATRATTDAVSLELWDVDSLISGEDAQESPRTIDKLTGRVHAIKFSADGKSLAAVSNETAMLRRWTFPSLESLPPLVVSESEVSDFAFHPTNPDVVAVSSGIGSGRNGKHTVAFYSFSERQPLRFVHASTTLLTAVEFSPDGKKFIVADNEGRLRCWRTAQLQGKPDACDVLVLRPHQSHIFDIAISTNGDTVATASADGYGKESPLDKPAGVSPGYDYFTAGVEFVGEDCVVTWGYEHEGNFLSYWDLSDGRRLLHLDVGTTYITSAVVLPSESEVAYVGYHWRGASHRAELGVVDLHSGECRTVPMPDGSTRGLVLADRGDRLFATVDTQLLEINLTRNLVVGPHVPAQTLAIASPLVRQPRSNLLAFAVGQKATDRRILLWDADQQVEVASRPVVESVMALAFSTDGILAAGLATGKVLVWDDFRSSRPPRELLGHVANPYGLTFSPSGSRLASAGLDGSIRLWNPSTANELLLFRTDTLWNYWVAFSDSGESLAYAGGLGTGNARVQFVDGRRVEQRD